MNRLDRILLIAGYIGLVLIFGLSIVHTNHELASAEHERCLLLKSNSVLAISLLIQPPQTEEQATVTRELVEATNKACPENPIPLPENP